MFAIVGAVLGYLVGQTTTLLLAHYALLGGMFLNYSSLSAIFSTLIVMVGGGTLNSVSGAQGPRPWPCPT